jgi:hypothetical protein
MSELVEFLCHGSHPVELSRYKTADEVRECIDRGYILVRFTDTRGTTELGVRLDGAQCELDKADFASGAGQVRLGGHLNLDFVDIECVVDIELASLTGTGRVVVLAPASQ